MPLVIIAAGIITAEAQRGGPPKVDIFAKQTSTEAILVTWENPDDTADNIQYRYTVSRDVNQAEQFTPIFSSVRNIEEKTIDEKTGQEMFFYLDTDIQAGNNYTYQVSVGNIQGNPNPRLSDDTRPIHIKPHVQYNEATAEGHLIVNRDLSPITQIISWFEPKQDARAEVFASPIFTTSINPQIESYRLALEPVFVSNIRGDCDQVLEFEYSRNAAKGQDFEIVASIFEKELQTEDDTGQEVTSEVLLFRHQKTFNDFSDSAKLKQKWFNVSPEDQAIHNFTGLEVQFDITGQAAPPQDYRSLDVWQVLFIVPDSNNC